MGERRFEREDYRQAAWYADALGSYLRDFGIDGYDSVLMEITSKIRQVQAEALGRD